jgi:hypothetical protein
MAESALHKKIVELILQNIESGAIDRDEVRQIVVGLSRDGQSINIWQREEWYNYCEYESEFKDEQAIAEIPNSEWLSLIDSTGFSNEPLPSDNRDGWSFLPDMGIHFTIPSWQKRYLNLLSAKVREVKEALEIIASRQLLGEFGKLVGLMGFRVSNSGYADLVSMYHPHGTNLLPARERRLPGFSSIYGWMSLVDDGIIHFYPKGDNDDDANDVDVDVTYLKSFMHYRFSGMDFFTDDDDLVFQISSSGQQIEFSNGHTHEDWGEPGGSEVDQMIVEHFRAKAPYLLFDYNSLPPPDDLEGQKRWLSLFIKSGKEYPQKMVASALEKGGIDYANDLAHQVTFSDEKIVQIFSQYLEYYLQEKNYAALVELFPSLDIEHADSDDWKCFYRALLMLGRETEAYDTAKVRLKTAKPDKYMYTIHAAFFTIAGMNLGKIEDYAVALAKVEETNEDVFFVAMALVQCDNEKEMLRHVTTAVGKRKYLSEYAEKDFIPRKNVLDAVRKLIVVRNTQPFLDDEFREVFAFPASSIEQDEFDPQEEFLQQWQEGCQLKRLRIKESTDNEPEIKEGFNEIDGEIWARTKKGFSHVKVDSGKRKFVNSYEDDKCYYALVSNGTYIYAVTSTCLKIFSYSEETAPELVSETYLLTGVSPDALALSDGMLVVVNGRELEIYDVSDVTHPAIVSYVSLTTTFTEY